ncbi:hypothetical protein C9890_0531 [Perkinsus sp. BL_2016]|nr:hypothetical protein C9890_0531 [Perkinsus sp. BL_2016]
MIEARGSMGQPSDHIFSSTANGRHRLSMETIRKVGSTAHLFTRDNLGSTQTESLNGKDEKIFGDLISDFLK